MSFITASISSPDAIISKLNGMPDRVHAKLLVAVSRLTYELEALTKSKLGGAVLQRRTGNLSHSIHSTITDTGTAVLGKVSSNAKYAAAHEYGINREVMVREHLRMQTHAFGRIINPIEVAVRSHSMRMNLPEKSFLRSSLEDMRTEITQALEAAVNGAQNG